MVFWNIRGLESLRTVVTTGIMTTEGTIAHMAPWGCAHGRAEWLWRRTFWACLSSSCSETYRVEGRPMQSCSVVCCPEAHNCAWLLPHSSLGTWSWVPIDRTLPKPCGLNWANPGLWPQDLLCSHKGPGSMPGFRDENLANTGLHSWDLCQISTPRLSLLLYMGNAHRDDE